MRARLLPDLRVARDVAYAFGWRVRDEVLTLERKQIDFKAGTIRVDPGTTKNDDGRLVFLTPALTAALAEQLDRVDAFGRSAEGTAHKRAGSPASCATTSGGPRCGTS